MYKIPAPSYPDHNAQRVTTEQFILYLLPVTQTTMHKGLQLNDSYYVTRHLYTATQTTMHEGLHLNASYYSCYMHVHDNYRPKVDTPWIKPDATQISSIPSRCNRTL